MGKKNLTCAFPVARIKKMMQSDEEVGKIATGTPLLVSKALELVIEDLLRESVKVATSRNTNTITPQHLKECVSEVNTFDFLRGTFENVADIQDTAPQKRRTKKEPGEEETPRASASDGHRKRAKASKPPTPRTQKPAAIPEQIPIDDKYALLAVAAAPPSAAANDDEDYDDEDDEDNRSSAVQAGSPTPQQAPTPNVVEERESMSNRISVSSLIS